jgi:O-antigen/teichoic acid export membrane protein
MREQLKALSKETLVYGASTVVGRFLNFLLVPFYVNVLHSSAEYGISTSLYTYMSFFNIVYTMGLEAAYFRYASKGDKEYRSPEEEKRLFSSPFLFILAIGLFFSLVIYFAAPSLVWPTFHDPKRDITPLVPMLTSILQIGALIVFFDSLAIIPFAVLRLEHAAKKFATFKLVNIVVTLILNFVFILGFHWGVRGIFIANLSASLLVFLLLIPTIRRHLEFKYSRGTMKTLLPFGLTNVPAYLAAMMVQVIDRPIVQSILGLAVLGVYQANYRMGFTMMVFVSLFEYAWRPFFLKEAKTDDARARKLFARVFTYFMLIALVGFLFLSIGLPYIVSTPIFGRRLLKPEYLTGLNIIPVVLLAYVFQGMYTNFIAGIYIKNHNKVLPWITGLGAIVNVSANLILIPMIGIMGAALATLFAYMAMAIALYFQAQKVYRIDYDWKRIGSIALIVAGCFGLERGVTLSHLLTGAMPLFIFRVGILIASVGLLFLTGVFSASERQLITQMLSMGRGKNAVIPSTEKETNVAKIDPEPLEEAGKKLDT